jgi:superfamily I DNA/RNA helicase
MRFPTLQDLSEEQRRVYDLPLSRDYLVTGPPGTGKTVIALHRASMLALANRNPRVLAYSRLLTSYAGGAADGLGLRHSMNTYHRWLRSYYSSITGRELPEKGSEYHYDWDEILSNILEGLAVRGGGNRPVLVVDEGQDLPPEFYSTFDLLKQTITVFADENQRLDDQQSTLADIRTGLRLSPEQEYCLTFNYRNTRQIAQLAARFFAGLPSGIPAFPDRMGDLPQAVGVRGMQDFVEFLVRFEGNFSDLTIGVFTADRNTQRELLQMLQGVTRHPVEFYENKAKVIPDLDRPGIKLIQMQSAKGLEFDAVFIPNIHRVSHAELGKPDTLMRYYVLLSRARTYLYLFHEGSREQVPLLSGIPENLLEWR